MFYLIAIPVCMLWFHSMYLLLEKYNGKEPLWLKCYLTLGMIYFIATPTLAVKELVEFLNLSNGVSATIMGITGTLMILFLINKTPKTTKSPYN